MGLKIYQVDSFTSEPFAGNPAGVCLLPVQLPDAWMQNVAREMNLSETAFLLKEGDGYRLRWFTPLVEVDLCGHATLASAHILWEIGELAPSEQAYFYTRCGDLTAIRKGHWIEMDFPARPAVEVDTPPEGLTDALGVKTSYIGKNVDDYLVEVESEEVVRDIQPDYAAIQKLPVRGVIVTSRSKAPEFDFVSRFFAPAVGINEDPVTGSAHTALGPFWSERLGKLDMVAFQASARGGILRVSVVSDRVLIGGQAVTVIRGELA